MSAGLIPRQQRPGRIRRLGSWLWRRPQWLVAALAGCLLLGGGGYWGVREWRFHTLLSRAEQEVTRGHNAAAIAALDQCKSLRPDHRRVLLLSARVARRTGHLESAAELLEHYWQLYGDTPELVLERQLLKVARGEPLPPSLRESLEQDTPDALLVREAFISGLLHRFRWGEAGAYLTAWLERSPQEVWAVLLLARLQEMRDDLEDAIRRYQQVLELDPEHDDARQRLAALLLRVRRGEEAEPHLRYLRDRLPYNLEVRVHWAQTLTLLNRPDEAAAELDAVLALQPEFPAALAERGKIAQMLNQTDQALELLRRAIAADPGDLSLRYQYATLLARTGDAAEAQRQRDQIRQLEADSERIKQLIEGPLQRRPNDPAVYHEIGMIALRAGLLNEGLRWLRLALDVDPNHLPTHRVLMIYYEETGQPALAAKHRAIVQKLQEERPR